MKKQTEYLEIIASLLFAIFVIMLIVILSYCIGGIVNANLTDLKGILP